MPMFSRKDYFHKLLVIRFRMNVRMIQDTGVLSKGRHFGEHVPNIKGDCMYCHETILNSEISVTNLAEDPKIAPDVSENINLCGQ
jgi:hypothetical protein